MSLNLKAILLGLGMCALAILPASAQLTNPQPAYSLGQDGVPVDTTNPDVMCAGPTSSQIQDCKLVTPPVYASGGCTTTPAIVGSPKAFKLTNGASGCSGSTMVLTLPTARNGWVCHFHDTTTATTYDEETTFTVTSVTLTNYTRTTGVALTWVASDVIVGDCDPF